MAALPGWDRPLPSALFAGRCVCVHLVRAAASLRAVPQHRTRRCAACFPCVPRVPSVHVCTCVFSVCVRVCSASVPIDDGADGAPFSRRFIHVKRPANSTRCVSS